MKNVWLSCMGLLVVGGCMVGADDSTNAGAGETDVYSNSYGNAYAHSVVKVVDQTWHCNSPVDGLWVKVTEHAGADRDAIHIDEGCTGRLHVDVYTESRDGLKVHGGAHDLTITGSVQCNGKAGIVHQDGAQVMGGTNITFKGFQVDCPTGNNGAIFWNPGLGLQSTPTNVVCDGCNLRNGNAAINLGRNGTIGCGARNSVLHLGAGDSGPPDCRRIDTTANQEVVDVNNTCVPYDVDPPTI